MSSSAVSSQITPGTSDFRDTRSVAIGGDTEDQERIDKNQNNVPPGPPAGVTIGASVGGAVGASLLVCCCFAIGLFVVVGRRNKKKQEDEEVSVSIAMTPYEAIPKSNSVFQSIPEASGASHISIEYKDLQFGKLIGHGAFGEVFECRWRGTKVAVKQLKKDMSEQEFSDFCSEAVIMKRVGAHPNVVQFLGLAANPERGLCIVTQFCSGGSLYDLLHSSQQIDEKKLIKIVMGTSAGMLHLAQENVVHRDLAARNILLDSEFEPRVSDFGMSRVTQRDSERQTSSIIGPLKYMAPECLSDQKYSEKSDVWAWACTMYEIFTRNDPYAGKSPLEVAIGVAQGLRLETPKHMSPAMGALFRDCLKTNAADRPSFVEVMSRLEKTPKLWAD
jgi:serine/threonine protein kinase